MQGRNNNPGAENRSAGLNWLRVIPEAWAISVQVFLHRQFGERFLGLRAAAVVALIPFYCILWPQADLRPMLFFFLAYLAMCLMARLGMVLRHVRGGVQEHSRYGGYPLLMTFFPRLSEITVKRWIEPLLVIMGGVFTLPLNQPLGFYWMMGGLFMGGVMSSAIGCERRQATDMYDSVLEQEQLAERFRKMRGEDF